MTSSELPRWLQQRCANLKRPLPDLALVVLQPTELRY
jgi:hypothetical protein